MSRDELAAAIWPEQAPPGARATLRTILSRLRGVLGADVLNGRDELCLELPGGTFIDTEVAAAKIHEAEAALHAEDWVRGLAAATIAYTISERGFLVDEDAPWVAEQRRWLEDVHLRARLNATASQASASAAPRSRPPSAMRAGS